MLAVNSCEPNAYTLAQKASNAWHNGCLKEAMQLYCSAVTAAKAEEDMFMVGPIFSNLALVQDQSGDPVKARATATVSIDVLDVYEDTPELIQAIRNLGSIELALGDLENAQNLYERALGIAEDLDNGSLWVQTLIDLSLIYKDTGRYSEAKVGLEKALTQLGTDDSLAKAHALAGLGLVHQHLELIPSSRTNFLEALLLYRTAHSWENEAIVLHNLGQLEDNQANAFSALGYYFQSLEINLAHSCFLGIAEDLSALTALVCHIHSTIDRLTADISQPLANNPIKITDLLGAWQSRLIEQLGSDCTTHGFDEAIALTQAQNLPQAMDSYEQLASFHQKIGNLAGEMRTWSDLAFLQRNQGKLAAAVSSFDKTLALAKQVNNPDDLHKTYVNRADVKFQLGQIDLAISDYTAATEVVEDIRTYFLSESDALDYFAWPKLSAYERLIRIHAKLDQPTNAFLWLEKARSREFLRLLRFTPLSTSDQVANSAMAEEQAILKAMKLKLQQFQSGSPEEQWQCLDSYRQQAKELKSLWSMMSAEHPEHVSLRQGEPATWHDIRQCLAT